MVLLCCRYETGQHFLSHEDGFPALLATANGFQRHATLLLYLNDVQQVRQQQPMHIIRSCSYLAQLTDALTACGPQHYSSRAQWHSR